MKPLARILVEKLPDQRHPIQIPDEEAEHLTRVLRHGEGALIEALDGRGGAVHGKLTFRSSGKSRQAWLEWESSLSSDEQKRRVQVFPIRLEIAMLKGEAMEWVVEKSVELGVRELVPLQTAHTVVQMSHKTPESFQQRWQKIADQSLKQCGRLHALRVHVPTPLQEYLSFPESQKGIRFWGEECEHSKFQSLAKVFQEKKANPPYSILIGPEGGWSEAERRHLESSQVIPVNLSPWILRAETAALAAVSVLSGMCLDT